MKGHWSGSGLIRNTAYGHPPGPPAFCISKENRVAERARSPNIFEKILRPGYRVLGQVLWWIISIPTGGPRVKRLTRTCCGRFSTVFWKRTRHFLSTSSTNFASLRKAIVQNGLTNPFSIFCLPWRITLSRNKFFSSSMLWMSLRKRTEKR